MSTTNNDFYEKMFYGHSGLNTSASRYELETLPCPFCTKNVSDETMQAIIDETEEEVLDRLSIAPEEFDWENWRHSETWYEAFEKIVVSYDIPYYEDLEEDDEDSEE